MSVPTRSLILFVFAFSIIYMFSLDTTLERFPLLKEQANFLSPILSPILYSSISPSLSASASPLFPVGKTAATSMKTMRAAVVHKPGGPESIILEQRPIPVPGKGWVLIRVHSFGLNRTHSASTELRCLHVKVIHPAFNSHPSLESRPQASSWPL